MLPAIVELLIVTVPFGWTLIPPPLIGASLSMIAERTTVVGPKLMMAPPPTPVVVLCEKVESSTVSVPLGWFAIAPPFAPTLLENVEFLTVSVPLFSIAPPTPVVVAYANSSPSIVTFDAALIDSSRVALLPLSVGVPLWASSVRLGPANVMGRAVGVGAGSA